MENKPDFKVNLLGYDKEEVLKYIDEMRASAQKAETQLQEKMDQITRSREQLEEKIAAFESRVQDVSVELDKEKGKNKKLSEMIELLQEEIDRQRRRSEASERDYQTMQQHNHQLLEQVRQAQDKSRRYDEAAASIGSAILQAQQTANTIIGTANDRAQLISKDADRFIGGVLEKIEGMQQDFHTLRGKMNESIAMLNARFDQIEADIAQARTLVGQTAEQLSADEAAMFAQHEESLLGKAPVQP